MGTNESGGRRPLVKGITTNQGWQFPSGSRPLSPRLAPVQSPFSSHIFLTQKSRVGCPSFSRGRIFGPFSCFRLLKNDFFPPLSLCSVSLVCVLMNLTFKLRYSFDFHYSFSFIKLYILFLCFAVGMFLIGKVWRGKYLPASWYLVLFSEASKNVKFVFLTSTGLDCVLAGTYYCFLSQRNALIIKTEGTALFFFFF